MSIGDYLSSVLTFSTARTVLIQDWKSGAIYYALVCTAIIYSVVNSLQVKDFYARTIPFTLTNMYAENSIPTPSRMLWDADGPCPDGCNNYVDNYVEATNLIYDYSQSSTTYCDNRLYDHVFSPAFQYKNLVCDYLPPSAVWSKASSSSLFFKTLTMVTSTTKLANPAQQDCAQLFSVNGVTCPGDSEVPRRQANSCLCSAQRGYLHASVENMNMVITHGFDSEFSLGDTPNSAEELPQTILRAKGCNPETDDCDLMNFDAGESIRLSISNLLVLLNIDLDGDSCEGEWGSEKNAAPEPEDGYSLCPKTRVSGLSLEFELAYYNFEQAPGMKKLAVTNEKAVCIMTIDPRVQWTANKPDSTEVRARMPNGTVTPTEGIQSTQFYHYGIQVELRGANVASIAKIDSTSIINALIQMTVLISLASTITLTLVKFVFPLVCVGGEAIRYAAYKSIITENVSFTKLTAQFAVQAIVAAETHRRLDPNGDGIDKKELESELNTFLDPHVAKAFSVALLEIGNNETLVMEKGEDGEMEVGGERLNSAEFVNLATNGPLKFDHLEEVLDTLGSECFGTTEERNLGERIKLVSQGKSFRAAKANANKSYMHTEL